jgi:hypothetical protein
MAATRRDLRGRKEELEVEHKEGLLEVVDLLVKQILVVEVEVDLIPLLEVVVEEVV